MKYETEFGLVGNKITWITYKRTGAKIIVGRGEITFEGYDANSVDSAKHQARKAGMAAALKDKRCAEIRSDLHTHHFEL